MMLRIARKYRGAFVSTPVFLQRMHAGERGPSSDRFGAPLAPEKWLVYDRKVFERVRREYSVEEWVPGFAKTLSPGERSRAAYFKKACVAGRHAMWPEALNDLHTACRIHPGLPASDDERLLIARILMEESAVRLLAADKTLTGRLAQLAAESIAGRSMRQDLAAPLYRQVREDIKTLDFKPALDRIVLLVKLTGALGAITAAAQRALRKLAGKQREFKRMGKAALPAMPFSKSPPEAKEKRKDGRRSKFARLRGADPTVTRKSNLIA
jgi:hypothetical protein